MCHHTFQFAKKDRSHSSQPAPTKCDSKSQESSSAANVSSGTSENAHDLLDDSTLVMATVTAVNFGSGDFVAVKLDGKRSSSIYMAEVIGETEQAEVHLRFMKKCGKYLYMWPQKKDESWEPLESILCVVAFPTLANQRRQFCFLPPDMDNVRSLFSLNNKDTLKPRWILFVIKNTHALIILLCCSVRTPVILCISVYKHQDICLFSLLK